MTRYENIENYMVIGIEDEISPPTEECDFCHDDNIPPSQIQEIDGYKICDVCAGLEVFMATRDWPTAEKYLLDNPEEFGRYYVETMPEKDREWFIDNIRDFFSTSKNSEEFKQAALEKAVQRERLKPF